MAFLCLDNTVYIQSFHTRGHEMLGWARYPLYEQIKVDNNNMRYCKAYHFMFLYEYQFS